MADVRFVRLARCGMAGLTAVISATRPIEARRIARHR